ncbi:hypothetical protein [Paraburkholderia phymatum]
MFDAEGRVGHRGMWGIVGLAKRYPARLVEQARLRSDVAGTGECNPCLA